MEMIEYQVAVIDPDTRKILSVRTSEGFRLPTAQLRARGRLTDELQKTFGGTWGVHVLLLMQLETAAGSRQCLVAETLSTFEHSSLTPIQLEQLPSSALDSKPRSQLASLIAGRSFGRFARIGWIDEAVDWMNKATSVRIVSKARIRQYGAGEDSALLCAETAEDRFIWMKATGQAQKHELGLTSLLSRLAPDQLPKLLGIHTGWNAWLSDGGTSSGLLPSPTADLSEIAQSLAKLQRNTVGYE
jgi:hypothetical protein